MSPTRSRTSGSSGRGLPIVEALTDDCKVASGSIHVWFEMTTAGAGPAD